MKKIMIFVGIIIVLATVSSAGIAICVAGDDIEGVSASHTMYIAKSGEAETETVADAGNETSEAVTGASKTENESSEVVTEVAKESDGALIETTAAGSGTANAGSVASNGETTGAGSAVVSVSGQVILPASQTSTLGDSGSNKGTLETATVKSSDSKTNYIYERIRSDSGNLAVLGNTGITDEQYDQLNKLLKSYNRNVSLKAVTVDGSKGLSFNSTGTYFSACTIKAPYILWVYKQMENGNGAFDDSMTYTSAFYHGGSGSIKNSASGTVFSTREVLRRTIYESDNTGYDMCCARWGKDGYNAYMDTLGTDSLKLGTSNWGQAVMAEDLIIVWNEIYKYFLDKDNNEYAKAFYDSCIANEFNFFANALPDYTINQKSGWSTSQYGAGAIIWGENQTYLLAIYTDSSGSSYDISVVNKIIKAVDEIMNVK